MTEITKKKIKNYMKTIDTGTADGKVVKNQLKKAISMNESADTPFSDSINKKLQKLIKEFKVAPMPKPSPPTSSKQKIKAAPMPEPSKPTKKQNDESRKTYKNIPTNIDTYMRTFKKMGGKIYSNPSRKPKT